MYWFCAWWNPRWYKSHGPNEKKKKVPGKFTVPENSTPVHPNCHPIDSFWESIGGRDKALYSGDVTENKTNKVFFLTCAARSLSYTLCLCLSLSHTHAYTHKHIQLHMATLVFSNLDQKQALINGLLWVSAACLELYKNLVGGGRQWGEPDSRLCL